MLSELTIRRAVKLTVIYLGASSSKFRTTTCLGSATSQNEPPFRQRQFHIVVCILVAVAVLLSQGYGFDELYFSVVRYERIAAVSSIIEQCWKVMDAINLRIVVPANVTITSYSKTQSFARSNRGYDWQVGTGRQGQHSRALLHAECEGCSQNDGASLSAAESSWLSRHTMEYTQLHLICAQVVHSVGYKTVV